MHIMRAHGLGSRSIFNIGPPTTVKHKNTARLNRSATAKSSKKRASPKARSRSKRASGRSKRSVKRAKAKGKARKKAQSRSKSNTKTSRKEKGNKTVKSDSSWFLSRIWPLQRTTPANKRSGAAKSKKARDRPLYIPSRGPEYMNEFKFNTYLNRLRRKVLPDRNLDRGSMVLLDKMMKNVMHGIATKAAGKMGKRKTLTPKTLLRAMRNLMPKQLRDTAHNRGRLAVALDKYTKRMGTTSRPSRY